jgi:glucose-6-phosphate isomerase/transaldolase/glucose-6-phosphate isomerase
MKDPRSAVEIVNAGNLAPALERSLGDLERDAVVRRIWDRDATVWKPEGREISDRLGWLDAPRTAGESYLALEAFAASVRDVGLTRAVVLGMGGSSLAPEVFARTFPTGPGGLELEILDTTEPGTVAAAGARFDPRTTLFVVSSKSGTTAEVMALLAYFYDRARTALGIGHAGSRFVAVTDPGTPLEGLARELHFRRVWPGPPDVGGRFSALTSFGLLPAALKGIDLGRLLLSARAAADACRRPAARENPGALLGAFLGTAALGGIDKLTILLPRPLTPLAAWLEQLIAESTGKDGRGIVPVFEDRRWPAGPFGPDRLFVEIGPSEETAPKPGPRAPEGPGSPLVRLALDDPHDLAGQFFLWEFATAVAGRILDINPFDQPDVESTKKKTREILAAADGRGGPAGEAPPPFRGGLRLARPDRPEGPEEGLARLLAGGREGDYIAILAFLPRTPRVEELLSGLAAGLRFKTRFPVTVGFGPRYLHSTGQLHKGDGNRGLFLMLTAAGLPDVAIPAVPGIKRPAEDLRALFRAQADGDALALAEKGRRVLAVELASPVETGLASLSSFLEVRPA